MDIYFAHLTESSLGFDPQKNILVPILPTFVLLITLLSFVSAVYYTVFSFVWTRKAISQFLSEHFSVISSQLIHFPVFWCQVVANPVIIMTFYTQKLILHPRMDHHTKSFSLCPGFSTLHQWENVFSFCSIPIATANSISQSLSCAPGTT